MGKKFKVKSKFDGLDEEFKSAVSSMKDDEVRSRVSKVALDQQRLDELKTTDTDLAACREKYSAAGAMYRDGAKLNKLRISYCLQTLKSRGKEE